MWMMKEDDKDKGPTDQIYRNMLQIFAEKKTMTVHRLTRSTEIFCTYGLFSRWQQSAVENELSWNTMSLMAETSNTQLARFLTVPAVVEYCGVIHRGAFASLSSLYSALDSIFSS